MSALHDPITMSHLVFFSAGALAALLFVKGWKI